MDYTVAFTLQVTAESPDEAGKFALSDLRQEEGPWRAEVSCSRGKQEVMVPGETNANAPAMISTSQEKVRQIEWLLADLRCQIDEPVEIKLSDVLSLEVGSSADDDKRIGVIRKDWGSTTVDYTHEGIIVDVMGQDEIEPISSIALDSADLEVEVVD